jgi:hypothetical protein
MPKRSDRIADDLLLANGVWDLDPTLPLSPRQVSLITGLSVDQLKERRRTRPPKPPFPFRGIDDRPGSALWYPLGEALDYKRNRLPRPLPPLSPPTAPGRTFATFLTQALPTDVWPFQRTRDGQWIDFFTAVRLGQWNDPEGEAECAWLTLEAYLREAALWVEQQKSAATARVLKQEVAAVLDTTKSVSDAAIAVPPRKRFGSS